MRRSRLAVLVFGSAIAVGGATSTAFARSDDPTSSTPSSTTASTPHEAETHTATTGGPVTLNVAGVGTVTFTVDPTTAAISDVVVTPIDGVTTGAPVATPEGVRIQVTAADGTVRVLQIKAHHEDAGLEVETELEIENDQHDGADDHGNDNAGQNAGQNDGQDRGPGSVQGDRSGRQGGADDAANHDSAPAGVFTPGTTTPRADGATSGHDTSGSGGAGDSGSGSGSDGSGGGHSGGRN